MIMVGMEVPGKLCKITAPHQLAMGVNASLILSSNPCSWALLAQGIKVIKKNKKRVLDREEYFMIFCIVLRNILKTLGKSN
jgi:hypothetical protein